LARSEGGALVRLQNNPIPLLALTLSITLNLTLMAPKLMRCLIMLSARLVYYVLSVVRVNFQKTKGIILIELSMATTAAKTDVYYVL
jgi:hypothetical protein